MRLICAFLLLIPCQAVDVLTANYNLAATGHNPSETSLTPSNVGPTTFGKLGSYPVDDTVYANPLAVDSYAFTAGTKSAVIFATMSNTIYAYDQASFGPSALIWSIHFNAPIDVSTVPGGPAHGATQFISYNIGCMSTPTIDKTNGILYAVCTDGTTGSITTGWKLHKVNLATGAEIGTATQIIAKFPGAGDQFSSTHDTQDGSGNFWFNGHYELSRTPLALSGGNLYIGWTAYGDQRPGHGEIICYATSTMTVSNTWTCSPSPTSAGDSGLCSIWQSGRALPIDGSGNIYVATGNGGFDSTSNFGDAWVKLTSALGLSDWYSPHNNTQINDGDWDIGSSGPILVPGTSFLVGGSKDRLVRVMATSGMGHSDPGDGTSPTKVTADNVCNTGCAYQTSGIYNQAFSPADNMFFESDVSGPIYGMPFNSSTGVLSSPSIQTVNTFGFPGAFLSVSYSSGTAGTGIVWAATASGQPGFQTQNAFTFISRGTLRAFRASDLTEIYNSDAAAYGADSAGSLAKFVPPMVTNGKVYLPSFSGYVNVYGLGSFPVPTATVIGYR
jgi:hypothetical protein